MSLLVEGSQKLAVTFFLVDSFGLFRVIGVLVLDPGDVNSLKSPSRQENCLRDSVSGSKQQKIKKVVETSA